MIAIDQEICHNLAVTVEWDDQPAPSITPVTGRDQREVASQPQGRLIDFSQEVHDVTDAQAVPAKSQKPQTIREFERALQTLGFSQRESKSIASGGFRAIFHTEQLDAQVAALAETIAKYRNVFES